MKSAGDDQFDERVADPGFFEHQQEVLFDGGAGDGEAETHFLARGGDAVEVVFETEEAAVPD